MSAFASTTSAASLTITSSTGASNNAHGAAGRAIPFSPSRGFDPNRCDSDFGGNESSSEETSTVRSRRRKKKVNYCEMGVAADGRLLNTNGETIYGDENEKSVAMAKQRSIGAATRNGKSSVEGDNLFMGEGGNDDVTVRKSSTVKKRNAKEENKKKSVKKKKQTPKNTRKGAQLQNEKTGSATEWNHVIESSHVTKLSTLRVVARKIISKHYPHYQDKKLWPKPSVVKELVPEVATALWENNEFRKDLDDLRAKKRISPSSYNTKKKISEWLQTCNGKECPRTVLVQIYYGIRKVSKATKRAMENDRAGRGGFSRLDPAYAAELKARIVASKKRGRMRIE